MTVVKKTLQEKNAKNDVQKITKSVKMAKTTTDKPKNNAKSLEELQREVAELKKIIADYKNPEIAMKKFEEKASILRRIAKFKLHREKFQSTLEAVKEQGENLADLQASKVYISFYFGYNDSVELNNALLIAEMLKFMLAKIDAKIKELTEKLTQL